LKHYNTHSYKCADQTTRKSQQTEWNAEASQQRPCR
jgi:hypothetical protein